MLDRSFKIGYNDKHSGNEAEQKENKMDFKTITFKKKDGTIRTCNYISLEEAQERGLFQHKGGASRSLAEGMEVVYDVDAEGVRTINHATKVNE